MHFGLASCLIHIIYHTKYFFRFPGQIKKSSPMTPTNLKFARDPTAKSIYVGLMEHFSSYPMPY